MKITRMIINCELIRWAHTREIEELFSIKFPFDPYKSN